ncbi:MAG: hypothetical protein C0392_10340 [Syntrophus sp. (in: bacteria)]|nr:hypothetical protein [Syntrophus sp. (in: bacteria)]
MKKIICIICFMAFICAGFSTAVWAQEKKAPVMPSDKEKAEVAKNVDLFYKVVSYGETQKNPLILVSAVKLLDDLSFSSILKPGQDEKGTAVYDRVSLLNQAKQYAANDAELLAVIDKVQTPPEQTVVRHGGHGHGGHGGYYGHHWRGHGHGGRHWGCNWYQRCGHHGCNWVCR